LEQSKTCQTCREVKPFSEFHKEARRHDGLNGRCKTCRQGYYQSRKDDYARRAQVFLADKPHYHRDWKRSNPDKAREYAKKWAENDPGYYARRRQDLDYREKSRESNRRWRAANPERATESKKRRRARKLDRGIYLVSPRDYRRCLARHRNCCTYCGVHLDSVHWDHVMPLYRGGTHSVGNLTPACQTCNQRKSYKTLMEWRLFRLRTAT
jgi:hypothetical protein